MVICDECGKEDFEESEIIYNCMNCEKIFCSECFWKNHSEHDYKELYFSNGELKAPKPLRRVWRWP